MADLRKNAFKVYDKISEWFLENRSVSLMERKYLDYIKKSIPANASILDIGCGTGLPIFKYFYDQGYNIEGLDASKSMLNIAIENFPDSIFYLQDMRNISLDKKYNALIAWHSFFHLPSEDQKPLFKKFKDLLHAKGLLMFTSGPEDNEVWSNLDGQDLFHASLSSEEYKKLLEEANFEVLLHQINDPECGNATIWIAQLK